jgi:nickel/cobalt transporter (NicO) family protein
MVLRRLARAALGALALVPVLAAVASAHPLGNFTVNRALVVEVGRGVEIVAILDMAEIPAYEAIRDIDTDGDDAVTGSEGDPFAADACATWLSNLEVTVDDGAASIAQAPDPRLTFPAGAGGLPTLRLECGFVVEGGGLSSDGAHTLGLVDSTDDDRAGWREVTARTVADDASIEEADVPAESGSRLLTAYPEDRLADPPDVRGATIAFRLGTSAAGAGDAADRPTDGGLALGANDPLTQLVSGSLTPAVMALAVLLSLGLGAAHALSPGHGKTLVAAYVLGAGGSARAAIQIGLWVAISHTAGVFVLGAVTLLASRFLLPERLIAWLSLGSGLVVTGLGIFLLLRLALRRTTGSGASHDHPHDHEHPHDHPHGHAPAAGRHAHGAHGHDHAAPTGELSWRAAIALGFAGGAVPSASALIVLLVAISADRLLLGIGLIACFGIGMAVVLGGLALVVARVRSAAAGSSRWMSSPLAQRAARLTPVLAGVVVIATGVAFTAAAVGQLA